jgi:hypothetical protein
VHKRIISPVKVEFVNDGMLYIRGCWFDINILKALVPTEDELIM